MLCSINELRNYSLVRSAERLQDDKNERCAWHQECADIRQEQLFYLLYCYQDAKILNSTQVALNSSAR
jgi:hypothetical protein